MKNWLSQKRNMIFPWNKKFLNFATKTTFYKLSILVVVTFQKRCKIKTYAARPNVLSVSSTLVLVEQELFSILLLCFFCLIWIPQVLWRYWRIDDHYFSNVLLIKKRVPQTKIFLGNYHPLLRLISIISRVQLYYTYNTPRIQKFLS